jgi:hypothetical protein
MLFDPLPLGAGRRFFRHHGYRSMLKWRPSGFTWGKTTTSSVSTIARTWAGVKTSWPSLMLFPSR